MSRVAPAITVSDDERIVLLRWSKGRRTPARLVRRAKIVLRAADGWLTAASAVELGTPSSGSTCNVKPPCERGYSMAAAARFTISGNDVVVE